MWWKFLSVLRRVAFLSFATLLIVNVGFKIDIIDYFIMSVLAYSLILLISIISFHFEYKKYPNMKNSFITRIWREDFCNPIIERSQSHYQAGARLGALWEYRNHKNRSFSEKVKSFFVRIFVYFLIIFFGVAIIYAIYSFR